MKSDFALNLKSKLNTSHAKIGIVGMGYVGLPLALRFAEEKYQVVGFDIDTTKVNKLNEGQSYIEHIASSDVKKAVQAGLKATTDFRLISEVDAIILCVPTPLNKYREPDLSYVLDTTDSIVPYLRKGQVVSLESTTYPGTTDEELKPRLEKMG